MCDLATFCRGMSLESILLYFHNEYHHLRDVLQLRVPTYDAFKAQKQVTVAIAIVLAWGNEIGYT